MISTLLTVLIVIASIILVLVVLIQKSKGGGLASNFSSSNAIMGVRKTTDTVEKATWVLASFIIVLSIAAVSLRPKTADGPKSNLTQESANPVNSATPNVATPFQATPTTPASEQPE